MTRWWIGALTGLAVGVVVTFFGAPLVVDYVEVSRWKP